MVRLIAGPDPNCRKWWCRVNDDRPFCMIPRCSPPSPRRPASAPPISVVTLIGAPISVIGAADRQHRRRTGAQDAGGQPDRLLRPGTGAVRDWRAMLATLKMARDQLAEVRRAGLDITEDSRLPRLAADNHFTFLGARDYRLLPPDGQGQWRTWPPGPDQR